MRVSTRGGSANHSQIDHSPSQRFVRKVSFRMLGIRCKLRVAGPNRSVLRHPALGSAVLPPLALRQFAWRQSFGIEPPEPSTRDQYDRPLIAS